MPWSPGEVVALREEWRGQTYLRYPVRVVANSEREVVVYLAGGTRYGFPPASWPFADQHPWAERGEWVGHGVLMAHKWGESHAVWHFWRGEERRFAGWYVNMQAPFERDGDGLVTQDHELDLFVEPDGSWAWKDEQELLEWVPRGRFTEEEVVAIREEGERVLAGWPFPTGWEEWRPDPSWPVPELPDA